MKLAVDETKILIQKTHEQIDKERAHMLKTDQARAKRDEGIVKMSALIKEKEAFMDSISTWGVILYDEGKNLYIHLNYSSTTIFTEMMEVHGNELAIYVSHNEQIKHFPEDECEERVMVRRRQKLSSHVFFHPSGADGSSFYIVTELTGGMLFIPPACLFLQKWSFIFKNKINTCGYAVGGSSQTVREKKKE